MLPELLSNMGISSACLEVWGPEIVRGQDDGASYFSYIAHGKTYTFGWNNEYYRTNLMSIQVSTIPQQQQCCVLCCSFIMMVWQQALSISRLDPPGFCFTLQDESKGVDCKVGTGM